MSTNSESYAETLPDNAIGVVGMAGRFPGANNVSSFWDNLRRGEESITTFSEDELRAAGVGDEVLANPAYVRRAPLVVAGVDRREAREPGGVGQLDAAQPRLPDRALGALVGVDADRVGVPDVDGRAGERLARGRVDERDAEVERDARARADDVRAHALEVDVVRAFFLFGDQRARG